MILDVWEKLQVLTKQKTVDTLVLSGLIRFKIKNEIENQKKYRECEISYEDFKMIWRIIKNLLNLLI